MTVSCLLPTPHCVCTALVSQPCPGGIASCFIQASQTAASYFVPLKSRRETTLGLHYDIADSRALNNPKKGDDEGGTQSTFKFVY